ncbi:MAG: hypothetical protein AB7N76_12785 [Planctomycetota bacterium]
MRLRSRALLLIALSAALAAVFSAALRVSGRRAPQLLLPSPPLPVVRATPAPLTSAADDRQVERGIYRPPPLHAARGWAASLEAAYKLLLPIEDPAQRLKLLTARLAGADEPVVRQNLIFQVSLGIPWELARPWLLALWQDPQGEPGDRRDAELALAMSGELDALEAVEGRAAPSGPEPWLADTVQDHERLCLAGARERLRAYRALEVVDRAPYFKMTAIHAHVRWYPHPRAAAGPARGRTERDEVALPPPTLRHRLHLAWLARFPHHPGADDVALRVARQLSARGEHLAAARWFSRASLLPDQDVTHHALAGLLGAAELLLDEDQLATLIAEARASGQNFELLRYVRVRRLAARQGPAAGCAAAEEVAREDPDSLLARAWRARWAEPAPRGLESGVAPLTTADPLLRVEGDRIAAEAPREARERGVPQRIGAWEWAGQTGVLGRCDPWPEAVCFAPRELAAQLRTWSTLAELEARERAAGGDPDLVYKRAAVLFHEPMAFVPAYARGTRGVWSMPFRDSGTHGYAEARFECETRAHFLAASLFERLADRCPDYPGRDQALFSAGLAWKRLLTREAWVTYEDRLAAIRSLVRVFERVVAEHPQSPLSDDAARAAGWWRRAHPL